MAQKGISNKQRRLLEDMGYSTHKIARREKMEGEKKRKSEKRKKRFYNA